MYATKKRLVVDYRTLATPDYFHTCATNWVVSLPYNAFGEQLPLTGFGNTGVFANSGRSAPDTYREYIQAPLLFSLQPGRMYYGEFRWSLAEYSPYAAPALGMWFSNDAQTSDNPVQTGVYQLNGQLVQPQVQSALSAVPLDDVIAWTPVGGLFSLPAGTTLPVNTVTIGNFQNDADWGGVGAFPTGYQDGIEGAYYFLEDLILWGLPAQPADAFLDVCTSTVTLGAPLPPTPAGLNVLYIWTGPGIGTQSGPTLSQITVSQLGQYTFTVSINGQVQTYSPINVNVGSTNGTVLADTVYTGGYTFQAGKDYYLPQNTRFLDGLYELEPGSRLLMMPGVSLRLGPDARLEGRSATITAACNAMWGGILLQTGSLGVLFKATDMNQSQQGIVLRHADQDLYLYLCRFRENLISVEVMPTPVDAGPGRTSTIQNTIAGCSFSATSQFLPPHQGAGRYGQAQVNLGNWDVLTWIIDGNDFNGSLVGIYGGVRKPYGFSAKAGVAANLIGNTFHDCPVGGVIGLDVFDGEVRGNIFTISETYPATPISSFLQNYNIPAALYEQPVGFFGSLSASSVFRDNEFAGTSRTLSFPAITSALYKASTGAWLSSVGYAHSSGTVSGNTFRGLTGAGIQSLPAGELAIRDNEFIDCRFNLRVNSSGPVIISFPVTCNTFTRSSNVRGESAGIYVVTGAKIEFALRNALGAVVPGRLGTPGDVMKNLFAGNGTGGTFWHVYNEQNNPLITYKTFAAGSTTTTNAGNLATFNVTVPQGSLVPGFDPDPNSGNACSVEDRLSNGIQTRSSGGESPIAFGALSAPAPNPAATEATFAYSLPAGYASGELLVRESIQGAVVHRQPLSAEVHSATLALGHLRPGLYLASLVVQGRPVAAVRLQITR